MDKKLRRMLLPGRRVELKDVGCIATVYPMGLIHIQKFSQEIAKALAIMAGVQVPKSEEAALGTAIFVRAVPYVMGTLLDLVKECVRFDPDDVTMEDLPHWCLPPLVEAWLLENFEGEQKWRPWPAVADTALKSLLGKESTISGTLSSLLSSPGTDSKTSSTALPASSPIEAGASKS